MKKQRITLNDIAVLAGVTKMTVSRYLRTPEKVKAETAERIASVIEEVGFEPDPDNPHITSQSIPRVGVLIPSFNNQIFSDLLAGIEKVAEAQGFQTLVVTYDYSLQKEEEQIAALLAFNIKALILTDTAHTLRAEKYLQAAKIPIAEVMGIASHPDRINVGFDNLQAGYQATRALIDSGRKHIAYFGSMSDLRDQQRYQGYCAALDEAGLPSTHISPKRVSSIETGATMMQEALHSVPELDAIFCTNDDLAIGVLRACQAAAIEVPQHIAIVGFHGLEIGQITTPRLTSIHTPRFEVGQRATELLLQRVQGITTPCQVILETRFLNGDTFSTQ
ncbi:LacI family DNA-binding transcriptional regulator [Rosenbergiella collisarenosi]|uniref:LacI family DNA-binding transcriptional regulator n=1 Tax=Rosenbergiella collisarenosi TaxID=1544695 RepID=UPI001BDB0228|nr:LacI family DNA-binding transcriptional regulator [Rosenbergiella collisarenosi]MBT0721977.1 LacI family DNA-binding transcriptional regulator [Rosenbergiella collisarenosi]